MLDKKIIPRIFGGLGNQLFAYAASRRLALVNDAELILDHISGFTHDSYRRHFQLDHFNIPCRKATASERLEPLSRLRRAVQRRWNQCKQFERRCYLMQEGVDFDSRLLNFRPSSTLHIEGYWQSENYFKDVESTIRQDLQIKPPSDTENQRMAERMRSYVAVAVHVRFFDEPHVEGGIDNISGDYYSRAIIGMERQVPDAHYFVFSNHPKAARARIPLPDSRLTLLSHNQGDKHAYADLWLMRQCQHFIIANSTFSWWGAWLANHQDKIVIAPGFEKRDGTMWWGFKGLLPDEWIKI